MHKFLVTSGKKIFFTFHPILFVKWVLSDKSKSSWLMRDGSLESDKYCQIAKEHAQGMLSIDTEGQILLQLW